MLNIPLFIIYKYMLDLRLIVNENKQKQPQFI